VTSPPDPPLLDVGRGGENNKTNPLSLSKERGRGEVNYIIPAFLRTL